MADTDAYTFNENEELATMQIQVNPHRYVKVNGKLLNVTHSYEKQEDGKNHWVPNYAMAQMWVPPRIGQQLVSLPEGSPDKAAGLTPLASILSTRSEDKAKEALEEIKPTKRVRKTAADA